MARCLICDKRAVSGNAVSHAQNHTKRKFKPNLQKVNGLLLCTSCLRTMKTVEKRETERQKELAEAQEGKKEQEDQKDIEDKKDNKAQKNPA